ncbi:MAG TPA: GNAT family N-acetyltransferase [Hyphomonadaceae bacterium]|jgi:GNAT superfamily N-acetyltransferase|nr:GNAT family N-acetyltransferase [Hyphomonadaceae bacterium]HPI48924.1 GNAT family N-acetyltransferase [Hyphomonadaceae bacterium]
MDLVISRAVAADAADLGVIGPAAYAAAYHDDWDDAVGFFHQIRTFGPEAMAATLARADAHVWIARQDGAGVGFLNMFVGSLEPINQRPGGAEIPRIYLLPGARRGGIGRKLLDAAEAQAKLEGCDYVWLDVMEHAEWARAAYERWGFVDIGGKTFSGGLRPGRSRAMRVLVKELK